MSEPVPLQPGINLGLSFYADDGSFLSSIQKGDGFVYIGFVKTKDPLCQFFVENLCSGKVQIKDSRGFYLRRTAINHDGRFQIEAKQMTPDESCEFKLFTRNGKVVFQSDNGLFLSRIYSAHYKEQNLLEAAKKDVDICCEFLPEVFVKTCAD